MRYALLALAFLAAPAAAQTVATLPVTCNASGSLCTSATPVVNPDGTNIGAGGGSSTRTTAAGTSDTLAVPVQGVTNGVPQRIIGTGQTTTATAQTIVPATDSTAFPFNLTQVGAAAVSLGQKTTALSLPVTLSSDGTYATSALQTTGNASLGTIAGTVAASGSPAASAQTVQLNVTGIPAGTLGRGGAALATNQISVATTSTLVVAARTVRQRVTLSVGAANTCAFGNTGVTATTGFPLQPVAGATITLDTAAAIYAACSATTTVSYVELF